MIDILTYVIDNFQLYYDFNRSDIGYGIDCNSKVNIVRSHDLTFFSEKKDIVPEEVIWKNWKGTKLPFCFDKENTKELVTIENGVAHIHYDIIASAFYFLSGWNEYVEKSRDNYDRVSFESSIINKLKIVYLPVVNYYFEILAYAISKVSGIRKIDHWKGHDFATVLTHDIDKCLSGWRQASKIEMKKGRLFSVLNIVGKRVFGNDEFYLFKEIESIEKGFGAVSSYFFLNKTDDPGTIVNSDYHVNSKKLVKTISDLEKEGNDIGVHGSNGSYINKDRLKSDISSIPSNAIIGNRFHYLMFDPERSVQTMCQAELKYDTSLGFAEKLGFRRGFCLPFYLFDFEIMEKSEVLEIPLICMDVTLKEEKYMNLSPAEAFNEVKEVILETKKFGGVFTILWHNHYFSEYANPGWRAVYQNTLNYCRENGSILTSAKNVYFQILS